MDFWKTWEFLKRYYNFATLEWSKTHPEQKRSNETRTSANKHTHTGMLQLFDT